MIEEFVTVPTAPPRYATSFRKVGRWSLLAILFLAPWFFIQVTNDPADINKIFIVGFLTLVAFICFIGCVLDERRIEYPRSLLALFLLMFFAAQGISTWFSIAPVQSRYGALSSSDALIDIAIYILLFYLFSFFFRRSDISKIGLAMGGGLVIALIVAFVGPAGSAPEWGIFMAGVISVGMVVRPGELNRWNKIIFFIGMAVAIGSLIALNDQLLWLILAIFVMAVAVLRFEPREHFQYAFAIITIALFFGLISSRLPISPQSVTVMPQPSISASLATVQKVLTGPAILTGSGPATFALNFTTFPAPSPQGHDFAVTLLATGGLLSFLLFLCLIILAIQPFIHINQWDTDLAMLAAGSAFLATMLFLYPASFSELVFLFALLGMIQAARPRHTISFTAAIPWKSFALTIGGIVFAAASLAGVFLLSEKYAAAALFGQANNIASTGNISEAFSEIDHAIALDPMDVYYRGASGLLILEAKTLALSTDTEASAELPGVISTAVQAGENAVVYNPRDPENWANLGSVYEAIMPVVSGADSSAENSYGQAALLDPTNPQWQVDIGRTYIESASLLAVGSSTVTTQQSDWTNAETALNKAISLDDSYADPRILLAELYLQEGNIEQAIQKVQELEQQTPLDPGIAFELGYLYYQNNQISQAQQEFQLATLLDPDYSNARYFLGLIYDQQGMESQALAQFQKIQSLNPGNQQVAIIIANLEAGRSALTNNVSSSTLSGQETLVSVPSSSKKIK